MIGIVVLIVLVVGYIIYSYNNIIKLKENVKSSESDISVQLDRRGKVFDSLINTVKQAMDYEKSTLKNIIELRTKSINLEGNVFDNKEKQAVEEELSQKINSGELSKALNITFEAYPDLKANSNLLQLQDEIVSTENKLAYAKQAFNDNINKYYAAIKSFPGNIIVKNFPGLKEEFNYWKISEERIKQEEERRVEF